MPLPLLACAEVGKVTVGVGLLDGMLLLPLLPAFGFSGLLDGALKDSVRIRAVPGTGGTPAPVLCANAYLLALLVIPGAGVIARLDGGVSFAFACWTSFGGTAGPFQSRQLEPILPEPTLPSESLASCAAWWFDDETFRPGIGRAALR